MPLALLLLYFLSIVAIILQLLSLSLEHVTCRLVL